MSSEITLAPIGNLEPRLLGYLRSAIKGVFGCTCITGAPLPAPEYAYMPRRGQYAAGAILQRLQRGDVARVLGVADLDLYVPDLNFVFGLADPTGERAVLALPRLRESFYGRHEDEALFFARMVKEAVHELGHTYGLEHCNDRSCVMAFSNSLVDTDYKRMEFCERCTKKLHL
jgi:archaemetzincin